MATPTKKTPEESSRARVLESALEEFAMYGFAGARIDRIARRVKLNVRMIYYHFSSKEGLYQAVLKEMYMRFSAMLVKALDARDAGDQSLRALTLYFDLLAAEPRFADLMIREMLDGGDHLRQLYKENPQFWQIVHEPAFALLEAAGKAGTFRQVNARAAIAAISALMLNCFATRRVYDIWMGRDVQVSEWKEVIYDLIMNGLHPRPPGTERTLTAET